MGVFPLNIFFFSNIIIIISFIIKHSVACNYSEPKQQYIEVTHPLPFANLVPSCTTLHIFNEEFNNSTYSPPPNCSWTHVALQFNASSYKGYDGGSSIAAVWLAGVELLRTTTVDQPGIYWTVNKDVTRYSSILLNHNISLSFILENQLIINPGVYYHFNISFLYYNYVNKTEYNSKLKLKSDVLVNNNEYEKPADLIIPISRNESSTTGGGGFWFRVLNESEFHGKRVIIPQNTYKAVIEIYVSAHGYDEFWYTNPPDSYIQTNNLTSKRGHGAYREVLVNIDEKLVGSVVPFPVIYPGGIDPLYWEPLVSIGAFDHPSYEIDLTPYLGLILDGQAHFIGLGVNGSIPFWLVDANLHLWVDTNCAFPCQVQAKTPDFGKSKFKFERSSSFLGLDGSFKVEMKRKSEISFWVNSSAGNSTTIVKRELKFKNEISFYLNGTEKRINQKVKEEIEVQVLSDSGGTISKTKVKRKFPLTITSKTLASTENDTALVLSDLDHEWKEKKKLDGGPSSSLTNRQQCNGWMVVQDRNVLHNGANTQQTYSYSDEVDCYSRIVSAANGKLMNDTANSLCGSFSAL